jgi:hypothetical protein
MGKKSRNRNRVATDAEPRQEGAVGPRQPCPCGSGRRYKNCHGSASGAPPVYAARPFEGLASEADVIALREFVPAATAPLTLRDSDREVLLCSLLPGAAPAMVRESGAIWLGLQVQHAYGDPSRDLAAVLTRALDADAGDVVGLPSDPGEGPRLQDLVVDQPLEVSVHAGFDYWLADMEDRDGTLAAALDQANESAAPTERVEGVEAAYWTAMGGHEYLRWVIPHDEDQVLDALARLHAAGEDGLVAGDRLIGMFRAHGIVVPVWDLPVGTGAAGLAAPAAELRAKLDQSLEASAPLTSEERSARAGLTSRQLTIR